jgi:hypothetical protein
MAQALKVFTSKLVGLFFIRTERIYLDIEASGKFHQGLMMTSEGEISRTTKMLVTTAVSGWKIT